MNKTSVHGSVQTTIRSARGAVFDHLFTARLNFGHHKLRLSNDVLIIHHANTINRIDDGMKLSAETWMTKLQHQTSVRRARAGQLLTR